MEEDNGTNILEAGDWSRGGKTPMVMNDRTGGADIRHTSWVDPKVEAVTQSSRLLSLLGYSVTWLLSGYSVFSVNQSSRRYQQGCGSIDSTRSGATKCGIKQIKTLFISSYSQGNLISPGWITIVIKPTQAFVGRKVAAIRG